MWKSVRLTTPLTKPLDRYGLAVVLVLLATLARLPFEHTLRGEAPYAFYYISVVLVAWYAGTIPTVVAALLSTLASWFLFLPPVRSFRINDPAQEESLVLFVIVCIVLTVMARGANRLRERSENALALAIRAQQAANVVVWESDPQGVLGETADLGRVFGLDHGGAGPMTGAGEIHPDDRERVRQEVRDALRQGKKLAIEYRVENPSLGERWLTSIGEPVRDVSGPVRLTGITADITDRKRGELASARLAAIVECSDDAIVSKDLDGTVRSWNAGARRVFGYTADEAIGRNISFLIPPERLQEETEILERIRSGQRVHHFETVRQTKDGRRIDISLTVSPVRDARGNIIGASKIGRDITEQRHATLALQAAMQEREQLLNSERSARTEAERANRMRDEFVATLSHELRTPLTSILGWAQILTRNTTDPALMNKGVAVIERNARSQSRLVSDLLDVSRIIAGKLRLELQPLDIASVVEAAIETQSEAAEAKSIQLRKSLDKRIGRMIGDPARLQQVVWNLVGNAIKFTPAGGHIEISLRPTHGDAEIVVADSGIGIKPEFASHVFERFAQADGTISRPSGGLGLGLSIVKELVQLHGGTVSAKSAGVGKGATFTVRLPMAPAGDEPCDA